MAEAKRMGDEELLDCLSRALVEPVEPEPARLQAFLAHAREVGTPVPEVVAPVVAVAPHRPRRRVWWAAVPAAAAAVVLLVLGLTGVLSGRPGSLTRVDTAVAVLQSDLGTHASDTSTTRALDTLYRRMQQVPPGLRPQLPPGASRLVQRACRQLYGAPPPAGAAAGGRPPACAPPPARGSGGGQPGGGSAGSGVSTAPPAGGSVGRGSTPPSLQLPPGGPRPGAPLPPPPGPFTAG